MGSIGVVVCMLLLVLGLTVPLWWSAFVGFITRKPICTNGLCEAWRWKACTGGRCKHHCDLYCKCVPVGQPGELVVIKGGRSA